MTDDHKEVAAYIDLYRISDNYYKVSQFITRKLKRHAYALMKKVCTVADKEHVTLCLIVKVAGRTTTEEAVAFYKKYKFKQVEDWYMERKPK